MTVANIQTAPEPRRTLRSTFLYSFEAGLDLTPIGLVPEGLRMTVGFDGQVTGGLCAGGRLWGIDPLLVRSDGVGVIDAAKTIVCGDQRIYEHLHGYCLPPPGVQMPPLEALLDPKFEWPGLEFTIRGFSTFRGHGELAYLNDAIGLVRGHANFATRRLVIETELPDLGGS